MASGVVGEQRPGGRQPLRHRRAAGGLQGVHGAVGDVFGGAVARGRRHHDPAEVGEGDDEELVAVGEQLEGEVERLPHRVDPGTLHRARRVDDEAEQEVGRGPEALSSVVAVTDTMASTRRAPSAR